MTDHWNVTVGDGVDLTTYTIHVNGQVLHLTNAKQLGGAQQNLANFQLLGFTAKPKLWTRDSILVTDLKYTVDDISAGLLVLDSHPVFKIHDQVITWSQPVRHVATAEHTPKHRKEGKAL